MKEKNDLLFCLYASDECYQAFEFVNCYSILKMSLFV